MLIFKQPDILDTNNEVFKVASPKIVVEGIVKEYPQANALAILTLTNKNILVVQLFKEGPLFVGTLRLSKEIIPFIDKSKIKIELFSEGFKKTTNEVELVFDVKRIKDSLKKEVSEEVGELSSRLTSLETKLESFANRGLLKAVKILNEKEVKEGMIPVATVDGNFTAAYPFADIVKTINGIDAVNESILLTLENIPFENTGKNSKEVLQSLLGAVQSNALALNLALSSLKKVAKEVEKIKLELAEQKNTALF